MAVVRLPSILAREAGGRRLWETDAATLADALRALPVADLIFDDTAALRRLVNVFVDGRDARGELHAPLAEDAEITVVAAVAGGSD
jgi:molybdopterin converting factor small subunit